MAGLNSPTELFQRLAPFVIDQNQALEQISVSLYKHLQGIKVGNILLIGNSGTGKTTIMKAIERIFREDDALSDFVNVIRMNANLVANDESTELESNIIIERLRQNAERIMASGPSEDRFRHLIQNGVVFLDEIDKIRSKVGDRANPRGILAQESLLTLIEGEPIQIPLTLKQDNGKLTSRKVTVDTNRILFLCGGAFEGLYDMVYRRVASGEHRDRLVQEYLVSENSDQLEEKEHFSLADYVRYEDIFDYGMTPQFLGRFDEIIVLNDLSIHGLMRIFLEPPDSIYKEAQAYFQSLGIELQITKEALKLLAERASENHRLGARALRSLFKRTLKSIEFNPKESFLVQSRGDRSILRITQDLVERFT